MNLDRTRQIKLASRLSPSSGGWIPPTEERQSGGDQWGFTLLEAVIALLIMLIVALGSASLFSFSIYNNSGGTDRATSLAVAQQALERLSSAQFNSSTTDTVLNGGTTVQAGIVRDGRQATNLKGITVTVVPQSIGRGWAFGAGGTITLITQRSRSDR